MLDIRDHGGIFGGLGSSIKSVQTGVTTIPSGTGSYYVSISKVDMSKSLIISYVTQRNDVSNSGAYFGVCTFLSNSTLELVAPKNSETIVIRWYVIEFTNAKVQRGVNSWTGGYSITIPISQVDTIKSFPIVNQLVSSVYQTQFAIRPSLGSQGKEMYIDRSNNSAADSDFKIYWQVISFK